MGRADLYETVPAAELQVGDTLRYGGTITAIVDRATVPAQWLATIGPDDVIVELDQSAPMAWRPDAPVEVWPRDTAGVA